MTSLLMRSHEIMGKVSVYSMKKRVYRSGKDFKHSFPWIVPVCPMVLATS
jgi:hypothetical protein